MPPLGTPATIRPGRDDDADAVIALIGSCWAEYPGCVMDVDGENPELRALASYYAAQGGALWVAEEAGRVVGMVATKPLTSGAWEICRVYADRAARGSGLAHRLVDTAEAHARANGAGTLELWSDTRFDAAHRFYEKRSYIRRGPVRALNDLSNSIEFHYARPAKGLVVETLDTAAAASAVPALAAILRACVDAGASVSYLPPLDPAVATSFWRRAATAVAAGERVLLAGWVEGELLGTVMLDTGTPPNQPHRAEVQKLLVHPRARRRGLARLLMERAERAARERGRSLLTLDTRAGDAAEPLYRSLGYLEGGRIPGYALNADRTPGDTVFFYKLLG